jgi:hypothetical protein
VGGAPRQSAPSSLIELQHLISRSSHFSSPLPPFLPSSRASILPHSVQSSFSLPRIRHHSSSSPRPLTASTRRFHLDQKRKPLCFLHRGYQSTCTLFHHQSDCPLNSRGKSAAKDTHFCSALETSFVPGSPLCLRTSRDDPPRRLYIITALSFPTSHRSCHNANSYIQVYISNCRQGQQIAVTLIDITAIGFT